MADAMRCLFDTTSVLHTNMFQESQKEAGSESYDNGFVERISSDE